MATLMERRISDLANRMKLGKEHNERYVLMLGAGASISSEVPPTQKIISELLNKYGQSYLGQGGELDQFDKFWDGTPKETRQQYLQKYLDQQPSVGYEKLADLVRHGFIQLIISFNFDDLTQRAIEATEVGRVLELVNGYDPAEHIEEQIDAEQAGATIYQLHGSVRRPVSLRFSADDILDYDESTRVIVESLTARNIIICGYGFEDFNVVRAFAVHGKSVWWVNPEKPPRMITALQNRRGSDDFVVGGEYGYFDNFFDKLHKELTDEDQAPAGEPLHNPFRFLASHKETDEDTLYYRAKPVQNLYDTLKDSRPRTLYLSGKQMVGKTSLIRAGLMPKLKGDEFAPYYIRRCSTDIDRTLPEKINRMTDGAVAEKTIDDTLKALCKYREGRHVVLILDQFERAVKALGERPRGKAITVLDSLLKKPYDNLSVVPVFVVDVHFGEDLYVTFSSVQSYVGEGMHQDLAPLSKHQVRRIVHLKALRAHANLPADLLDELIEQYDHKKFTLAHIETICHLLTARIDLDRQILLEDLVVGSKLVTALSKALMDHEVLSHLEDLPIPEEQNLLRNVLIAASNSSRQNIAEYLKENFRVMDSEQIH